MLRGGMLAHAKSVFRVLQECGGSRSDRELPGVVRLHGTRVGLGLVGQGTAIGRMLPLACSSPELLMAVRDSGRSHAAWPWLKGFPVCGKQLHLPDARCKKQADHEFGFAAEAGGVRITSASACSPPWSTIGRAKPLGPLHPARRSQRRACSRSSDGALSSSTCGSCGAGRRWPRLVHRPRRSAQNTIDMRRLHLSRSESPDDRIDGLAQHPLDDPGVLVASRMDLSRQSSPSLRTAGASRGRALSICDPAPSPCCARASESEAPQRTCQQPHPSRWRGGQPPADSAIHRAARQPSLALPVRDRSVGRCHARHAPQNARTRQGNLTRCSAPAPASARWRPSSPPRSRSAPAPRSCCPACWPRAEAPGSGTPAACRVHRRP